MIRYVLNYSNRTHLVANDLNEVKWMSIENRIKYLAASHVFNCIDEQAPEYLQVFERGNDSHHYATRHSVTALIFTKGWFIWYKVLPLHRCQNLELFARRDPDYVQ